ncbi:MAG: transcription termination factor NusA [Tissierellia bacterium]|nr:transcription termination factor NusA [Tissierellia bacterium]
MEKDFIKALNDIEQDKGISKEIIFDALEKALVKSYEKNYDDNANVNVTMDRETGEINVYAMKVVVDTVEDPYLQINLDQARKILPTAQFGEEVPVKVVPKNFGRIAAQTARNMVVQKIKDAEREVIYDEFKDREREIITGNIRRIDHGILYIDLGRIEGIVPLGEQIPGEKYEPGQRLKLFIKEVKNTTKGAQVILSRADKDLVTRLLELEVPEINEGLVEIYSIAREAGSRTKLAVFSNDESVDPVGACVGFKGQRVKTIVDELGGEKLDIIVWSSDVELFLSNALSPADVVKVFTDKRNKLARILVAEDQLSLAIGKEGQNVRLAAKLTNWKIDIKGNEKYPEEIESGELALEFEGEIDYLESLGVVIPQETLESFEEKQNSKEKKESEDVLDNEIALDEEDVDDHQGDLLMEESENLPDEEQEDQDDFDEEQKEVLDNGQEDLETE